MNYKDFYKYVFFDILGQLGLIFYVIAGIVFTFAVFNWTIALIILLSVAVALILTAIEDRKQAQLAQMAMWDEHGEDL